MVAAGYACRCDEVIQLLHSVSQISMMYTSFIRPIMEYGGVQLIRTDITHLKKLDSVQSAAKKSDRFTLSQWRIWHLEEKLLQLLSFSSFWLAAGGRGVLKRHVPEIITRKSNKDYDSMRPCAREVSSCSWPT